jgi:tetratricopeptide (TPR) repeat protein
MATSEGPPGSGSETNTASGPSARLRPARAWYWLALGVFLAGVAWAALMFAVLIRRVDSFQRVPDPGTGVISLTHSGGYLIYYEGPGASSGNVPTGNVHVTPVSGSAAVQSIESYSGSLTYQFGHHEGTAVATLQITHPGRFRVTATSSTAPPGSHLAIGSSIAGSIAVIVIPALLLMLAGIGGAITIAIIRHLRAKRARQALTPLTGGPAAGARNNIGAVYDGLGDRQRALEYYQQALPIAREVGDRAGEAATLNNIGGVYDGLGDRQRALECYQQALPIQREVGDRAGEAVTRFNIAMVHQNEGQLDLAISELERVVDLDRQVANPHLQSDTAVLDRLRQQRARSEPGPS